MREPQLSVAVVGMGIEGTSLARYFLRQGADVTIHHWMALDKLKNDPKLGPQYRALATAGATFCTGDQYLANLTDHDVVGVLQSAFTYKYPQNQAALTEVRERGIPLVTNLTIFFQACPAPIIGVTGTNGKSTTTEMAASVLEQGANRVFTGGNLGSSPLDVVDELRPNDLVLLELSNYQLEFLDTSPWVAAVTNIAPDHLVDYAGDFEAYKAAKRRILRFQRPDDWAVLNADDPITAGWATACTARPFFFSRTAESHDGTFVREGLMMVRRGGTEETVCAIDDLRVRGAHNVENALCAVAIGTLADIEVEAMAVAITRYTGGAHRLEPVGEWRGVAVYNDSKSTTPSSTVAAIRAFPKRPLILLAGGRDKGLPFDELADVITRNVKHLIAFGEAAELLVEAVQQQDSSFVIRHSSLVSSLDEAVETAVSIAEPGDAILLSPACTSFDAFDSYAARGEHFKQRIRDAFSGSDT